ncbi:MAG: hypothetical protein KKH99_09955, partial [Proteobacteria bacterium]|nr:hypothetical protein [Pseudomonadota bacterium]
MNAIQKNNKEKRNQLMFDFLNKKKSLKEAYSINSQPIIGVVTFEDYEMAAVYPRKGEQYLKRIFIKG